MTKQISRRDFLQKSGAAALGFTIVPKAPRTQREITESHEMDWVGACKESADSRRKLSSDFSEAGPFNEMVVMGVLAVRLSGLGRELHWDGANMQFTNISDTDKLGITRKDNFSIKDGHPTFDRDVEEIPAKAFAEELIKILIQHAAQNLNIPPKTAGKHIAKFVQSGLINHFAHDKYRKT